MNMVPASRLPGDLSHNHQIIYSISLLYLYPTFVIVRSLSALIRYGEMYLDEDSF